MKRLKITIALILLVVVGVIGWQALQPGEPVYQGKPLSNWMKAWATTGAINDEAEAKAKAAVRQAGANAIPTLLRMLRAEDSTLKLRVIVLVSKLGVIKVEYIPAKCWHYAAGRGFGELGAKAQSAVPALIRIANEAISPSSQGQAIEALGDIGPPAKESVPSLLRWATNPAWEARYCSTYALGEIHAEPDRVLPLLITALHDPSAEVQAQAAWALGKYGPEANRALPALAELLNDSNAEVRRRATNALKAIDPKAAAKAGITNTP